MFARVFASTVAMPQHIYTIAGTNVGSVHQDCSTNYKLTDKIPVIFHNLRGHFIMQEIAAFKLDINVISNIIKN